MFGSAPKPPVDPETAAWADRRMAWLSSQFGRQRLRSGPVILPTPEFFPDAYDGSEATIRTLLDRVCVYMGVPPASVAVSLYEDRPPAELAGLVDGTVGLYVEEEGSFRIWVEVGNLGDPLALVATIAHEVGHVLLLGQRRVSADDPDHEPLTDLLTVFFGLGVITANAVVRETTWRMGHVSAWQVGRQGYLTMPAYGYALAVFARERGEDRPTWVRHLRPDVRQAFDRGLKYLRRSEELQVPTPGAAPGAKGVYNASTAAGVGDEPGPSQADAGEETSDREGATYCAYCGTLIPEAGPDELICLSCHGSVETNRRELAEEGTPNSLGYRPLMRAYKLFFVAVIAVLALIILLKELR
jgi:hypothetical protein